MVKYYHGFIIVFKEDADMNETTYNLKGLKMVYIGMLATLVLGIIDGIINFASTKSQIANMTNSMSSYGYGTSAGSGGGAISVIFSILVIAAFVIFLIGLSKSKKYSSKYGTAFRYNIIVLIVGIVGMIVAVVVLVASFASIAAGNGGVGGLIGAAIALLVIIVACFIFSLLAIKNILGGNEDIAAANGNTELARKNKKTWRIYLISTLGNIAAIIISVLMLCVYIARMFTYIAGSGAATGNGMLYAGLAFIGIACIFGIINFVMQIIIIVDISKICSTYDGKPIPGMTANQDYTGAVQGEIPGRMSADDLQETDDKKE